MGTAELTRHGVAHRLTIPGCGELAFPRGKDPQKSGVGRAAFRTRPTRVWRGAPGPLRCTVPIPVAQPSMHTPKRVSGPAITRRNREQAR